MIAARCQFRQTRLQQLLSGQLNEAMAADVARHIGQCETCRHKLEALAADASWWQEAQQLLSSATTSPVLLTDAPAVSNDRSVIEPLELVSGFLQPGDDPSQLGRLDEFEILEVIGHGGMGIVLKGYDRPLARHVAIKVLAPHYATSGAARRRFAREAQAAAAVVHPHVLAIHGVNGNHRLPYLVMPLVTGPSLQQQIDTQGPLGVLDTLRIGMQAAQGLAAAHAQGLVHRDVKPANILLENGLQRVLLTDFGLARAIDDVSLTHSGVIAGTPQYMSPEQTRGEPVDHRTDLFSLGSVLYTMCAGRPPFRADSTFGVMRKICEAAPRDLREINPEVPAWLSEIVLRLLAKQPDQRFQSAAEVASLLENCLAHLQHPTAVALPEIPGTTSSALVVDHLIARRLLWSLAAAGVLAATSLAAWQLWPQAVENPAVPQPPAASHAPELLEAHTRWRDDLDPTLSTIRTQLQTLAGDEW